MTSWPPFYFLWIIHAKEYGIYTTTGYSMGILLETMWNISDKNDKTTPGLYSPYCRVVRYRSHGVDDKLDRIFLKVDRRICDSATKLQGDTIL